MSSQAQVSYKSLFDAPGRTWFLTATALGRIPSAMKALACILLVQQLTGSYGMAGMVGAVQTAVAAILAPVLARQIDLHGERGVLLWSMMAHVIGVAALIAAAYSSLPSASMLVGAAIIGGSSVQFGSLSRARWVRELDRGPALERAYSLESMVDELGFVIGPMLVVPLCISVTPSAGIIGSMLFTILGTVMLLRQPSADVLTRFRPNTNEAGHDQSVVKVPAIALMIASLFCMGMFFGAAEIVIVAFSEFHGQPNAPSYIVPIWATGSFLGAFFYGARYWPGSTRQKIFVTFWWIGLGAVTILFVPTIPWLAAAVFFNGLAISPGMIVANLYVEQLAPTHKITEAFAWLGSSMATGAAFGSISAGYLVDHFGIRGGQWSAVVGGIACGIIVTLGAKVLTEPAPNPVHSIAITD